MYTYFQPRISVEQEEADIKEMIGISFQEDFIERFKMVMKK